jgi:hypothetical protein
MRGSLSSVERPVCRRLCPYLEARSHDPPVLADLFLTIWTQRVRERSSLHVSRVVRFTVAGCDQGGCCTSCCTGARSGARARSSAKRVVERLRANSPPGPLSRPLRPEATSTPRHSAAVCVSRLSTVNQSYEDLYPSRVPRYDYQTQYQTIADLLLYRT